MNFMTEEGKRESIQISLISNYNHCGSVIIPIVNVVGIGIILRYVCAQF